MTAASPTSGVRQTPPWAWLTFSALAAIAVVVVMYAGRGTGPFFDEWTWITTRRGHTLGTFLEPHNGHLTLAPIILQKILLAIAGLQHYWVFRLATALLHVACGLAVFRFVTVRLGPRAGLIGTTLILGLGAGAEDFLWPFQSGFLLALASGVFALSCLASTRRRSGLVAAAALTVSVASTGIGLVFLFAGIIFAALDGQRTKRLAVLIPFVLYALWFLAYGLGNGQAKAENLPLVGNFAAEMGSAAFGGLVGLGTDVGRPLLVLAVIAAVVVLARPGRIRPLVLATILAPPFLWALTALSRAQLAEPVAARYIYPGAILIVIAAAEMLRGYRPTSRHIAIGGILTACFVVAGADNLRDESRTLRDASGTLRAQIAALEIIDRPVSPTFQPAPQVAPQLDAGKYAGAERAFGAFVEDPVQTLDAAYSKDRAQADDTLVRAGLIQTRSLPAGAALPSGGTVSVKSGAGTQTSAGGCAVAELRASPVEITLEPGASVTIAAKSAAVLTLRRYSDTFGIGGARPLPAGAVVATAAADRGDRPWMLQVTGSGSLKVCGDG